MKKQAKQIKKMILREADERKKVHVHQSGKRRSNKKR